MPVGLNVYKAGLSVGVIGEVIQSAAESYGQADACREVLSRISGRLLGHVAGGVGRNGSDFVTVYYEIDRLPD